MVKQHRLTIGGVDLASMCVPITDLSGVGRVDMTRPMPGRAETGEPAMDLANFLLARIAEDEESAQATAEDYPSPWRGRELDAEGESLESGIVFDADRTEVVYWESGSREAADRLGTHIARHDPARVLAECAAKRAIVELHRVDHGCPDASGMDDYTWVNAPRNANCQTLRLLALPYTEHPDCRPEWAPTG